MTQYRGRPIEDLEVDDVDSRDYPDFCDAHICSATWADTGESLSEEELIALNEDCPELVWDLAYGSLH